MNFNKLAYRYFSVLLVFVTLININVAQVTIANGLPGCLPVVTQAGQSCNSGTTFFGVNASNQFQVQNVDGLTCCSGPMGGGDGETYFQFADLDISNYSNVNISMAFSAASTAYEDNSPGGPLFGCTGLNPPDNSHDQILFTYSIDGGPEVYSRYVHGLTQAAFTGTWIEGPLNGSTLTIKIYAANKAGAEIFYFQNLLVTGTLLLTAGSDKAACSDMPVDLDGVGVGTWTGGLGVFGDNMSPTTDYTIDAADVSPITLTYSGLPAYTGCPAPSDNMVINVNPAQNANFNVINFCGTTSPAPTGIVTSGGTFSFNPPPGDGAVINPTTGVITNAVSGASYDIQYVTPGPCPDTEVRTINVNSGPVGTLSGSGTLCPGQCTTFSFTFSGGTPPYTIGFSATPPGFPITVPGVTASTVFTICYTGLIPTFNPSTFTLNLPTFLSGTGTLVLTSISDASGCSGTVSGSYTLTLTPNPVAMTAGPLTACLDAFGVATFDLTTLDNTVNGGSGATVNWFTDAAGANPITNPSSFQTSINTTVYVSITNGSCTSARIPINLIVNSGAIGPVIFSCDAMSSIACSFCINTNSTMLVFTFTDGANYDVTVTNSANGLTSNGIVNNTTGLQVPIVVGINTFVLSIVNRVGSCPNQNTLNEIVTITVNEAPEIDPPTVTATCNPFVLPAIMGSNLSGNQSYYSGPAGTGSQFFEGQTIFTSQRIYIYDDFVGCIDEVFFDVDIIPLILYDTIRNIKTCDFAILPPITGVGVTSTTKYYKIPLDNTLPFSPGDTIRNTITLSIYDPNVDANCVGNNIVFTVTKNSLPVTPSLLRDCSGGAGNGSIQVNTPIGTRFEYSLNNGFYQTSNIFSGLANNAYQITVRDTITGCISLAAIIEVNCNCAFSPTITTPVPFGIICEEQPPFSIVIRGNSFGGSASQVTVTSNGAGSLTQNTFTTSPFDIIYIVNATDLGKIVSFTIVTNDPDGNGPCEPTTRIINVNLVPAAVAGRDSTINICQSALTTVNLNDYLQAFVNKSGEWRRNNTPIDPIAFDLNLLSLGNNDLFYIIGDPMCELDTAKIRFTVLRSQNAGMDNALSLCQNDLTNVNFNSLLGTFDAGGMWTQTSGTSLNLAQPNNVNISSLGIGIYSFIYTVGGTGCPPDQSTITITVNSFNDAGPDVVSSACAGASINVLDLVAATDKRGTLLFPNSVFGNFAGGVLNTTGLADGDYLFKYFLVNSAPCRNDTSDITIRVAQSVTAGSDAANSFCQNAVINLNSYLSPNASKGGEFKLNGVLVPGGLYDTKNIGTVTQLIFTYSVGDGVTCPRDEAIITLNVVAKPLLTLIKPKDICEGSCQDLSVSHNAGNGTLFISTQVAGSSTTYRISESITGSTWTKRVCAKATGPFDFVNLPLNNKYIISLDSVRIAQGNGCVFSYNERDSFSTKPLNTKVVNPILCQGATYRLATDTYSATKLTGQTLVTSTNPNACDTVYNVNLSFRPVAVRNFRDTFCNLQGSITFGGTTFNSANPVGTALLPIKTSFGCDSTVNVALVFQPIVVNSAYTFATCSDSYTYRVGNEVFGKNRPTGSVVIAGGSINGCDSLVMVNLDFTEFTVTSTTRYECDIPTATVDINFASEPGPFLFTVDGIKEAQSRSLPYSTTFAEGSHTIVVETSEGCTDTLTYNISDNRGPNVVLTQELLDDGRVQLIALSDLNAIYDITWTPSGSLSCGNCINPIANPAESTDYLFVYKYGEDCVDQLTIRVERINTDIVLPNIFSPDGNGSNEAFYVQLPDKVTGLIQTMQVFDRWGNKVFTRDNFAANDPTLGWDGLFKGSYVTPGVYTFVIVIKLSGSSGSKILKGDVTVIR